MRVNESLATAIGGTPLVRISALQARPSCELLAKLERQNPTGSVKDRAALAMLEAAEKASALRPGMTIVEGTSGNTGIALAALARAKGYRAILVMPDTISKEKVRQILAYGAQIVFTPGVFGMKRAFAEARRIADSMPDAFVPDQSRNPANPEFHRVTTGPEIWADTGGTVDVCVAGVGTGGTLTGVGEFLKAVKPTVEMVAVEPKGSPVLSGGQRGPHRIEGIGVGFVPETLRVDLIDRVEAVSEEEAIEALTLLARTAGIFAGLSSGAAVHAALRVAKQERYEGKVIVVILPDSGERYPDLCLPEDPQPC
jgi:cysteine synthase